jgi:hypothetical protein
MSKRQDTIQNEKTENVYKFKGNRNAPIKKSIEYEKLQSKNN